MNIAFACPQCEATTQAEITADAAQLSCRHCGHQEPTPADAFTENKLTRCLVCGATELFIRKDFSQRLGIAIIVTGFIISTIFWAYYMLWLAYAALFVTAALDLILYFCVKNLLECYRCHAQYRDMPGLERYEPFNLEVHERYRQQAIRMKAMTNYQIPMTKE